MKWVAIVGVALVCAPAAFARQATTPLSVERQGLRATEALAGSVSAVPDQSYWKIKGNLTKCHKKRGRPYRCRLWAGIIDDAGIWSGWCFAPVLLTRREWRFPIGLSSCPVDWLPYQ